MNVTHSNPSEKEASLRASFFSHNDLYAPTFFKTHQKTNKKFYKHALGYLAYEKIKDVYVVAGEPVAACREDSLDILDSFIADHEGFPVCGYYFNEDFVKECEHKFYQLGVERSLGLEHFNGNGQKWEDYRRALKKGEQEALSFEELQTTEDFKNLKAIEKGWLKNKKIPAMGFLLSRSQINDQEKYFLVKKDREIQAFVSYFCSTDDSVYIDQFVQSPSGHKWALDFAIAKLIKELKSKNIKNMHFGLCAFQDVQKNSLIESGLSKLKYIKAYPSQSIYAFKNKYTDKEVKSYLLLNPKMNILKQTQALFKATFL